MVKRSKLYTRTGDDGTTALVGGTRIQKSARRVACYGDIDELNSILGIVRTKADQESVSRISETVSTIQHELFNIGAVVASPPDGSVDGLPTVGESEIAKLEALIDSFDAEVPQLKNFILPGGTEINAHLHLARTVCRRAERAIVKLSSKENVSPLIITYINRLSDLLFVMARWDTHRAGAREYEWKK